jgi:general secretion pathway protein A
MKPLLMSSPFDRLGRPDSPTSPGFLSPVPADPRPIGLTYEPFYGLKEKPFSLTSDTRFFYQSRSHAPAFDDLLNAIRRRESLNVLTGDIGTGKTTLCRAVLQSLDRKTFSAFVPDPFASREELLKVLLTDFGVASVDDVTSGRLRHATRTELSYLLYEFLATLAPLQAFAVVIIDEAQNLSHQLLEEVRILSDADGQLQVVLVGQLELRDRLKVPEMRQLDQRVSVHCQLQPLDIAGVAGYISHRLHVAGGSSDRVRFTGEAVEAIYQLSGGLPRVINRVCDRALRYGYSMKEATIDADIVESSNPNMVHGPLLAAAPPIASVPTTSAPAPRVPVVVTPPAAPVAAAAPATAATPEGAAPTPIARAQDAASTPIASTEDTAPTPIPLAVTIPAPPVAAAPAREPQPQVAEPTRMIAPSPAPAAAAAPPVTKELPDQLEAWLREIDKQPTVDLDWRQRWAPTNAVAAPPASRSGVTLRIPAASNPYGHTHTDRLRRRLVRRILGGSVALILFSGAIVVGPASIAASLDIWLQIDEQLTPPAWPQLPASLLHRPVGAAARVEPPIEPLDRPSR